MSYNLYVFFLTLRYKKKKILPPLKNFHPGQMPLLPPHYAPLCPRFIPAAFVHQVSIRLWQSLIKVVIAVAESIKRVESITPPGPGRPTVPLEEVRLLQCCVHSRDCPPSQFRRGTPVACWPTSLDTGRY